MSNSDLLSMAVRSLFKRKLRTFLTVFGVVIGSASIVVMISLGVGMSVQFDEILRWAGNITVIEVESEAYWNSSAPKGTPLVDDNAIQQFSNINGVEAVSPVIIGDYQLISGKLLCNTSIYGINLSMYESLGYKIEQGRLPEPTDKLGVIMGGTVTQNFYNPKLRDSWMFQSELDPFEDDFQLLVTDTTDSNGKYIAKPKPITVTATTPEDGFNSYTVYIDIDTVRELNAEKKKLEDKYNKDNGFEGNSSDDSKKGYWQALVKCKSMDSVAEVQEQIRDMGYMASSQAEWLSTMKQTSDSLQTLLGAIGGVSLFVAAIGITNTMLMSIYERTKEIGVMKVIGATLSDVRKLFLVEAALIGFFGGIFGLIISFGISFLLNNSGGLAFLSQINWSPTGESSKISIIPFWLCGLALSFSTVVGVLSGYFPAVRAMKLSALAAIKAE